RGSGAYTNVVADATGTNGTYGADVNSTGNDVTLSYDFRLYVVDTFGKSAESILSIGTARVLFDKHKDLGMGIGKLDECGELEVAGEMCVAGQLNLVPESGIPKFQIHSRDENGHAYIEFFGSDGIRKAYVGIPNKTTNRLDITHDGGENINLATSGKLTFNNTPIVNSGSNSNGNWVQFYDGTQICTGVTTILTTSGTGDHKFGTATFPKSFVNTQYRIVITPSTGGVANFGAHTT